MEKEQGSNHKVRSVGRREQELGSLEAFSGYPEVMSQPHRAS